MRTALAILILALVVLVADALSTEEEEAIQALLLSIPALNATSPPWTSNSSAACDKPSFYGLNCSNGEEPHVIGLYFHDQSLTGVLPMQLSGLSWLQSFELINSTIDVSLSPFETMLNLTRIVICDWEGRPVGPQRSPPMSLSGLSALVHLRVLELQTVIDGSLPGNIGQLRSLRHLSIRATPSSSMFGSIPPSFWDLSELEVLRLYATHVYDDMLLPPGSAPFPRLEHLLLIDTKNIRSINTIFQTSRNLKTIEIVSTTSSPDFRDISSLRNLTHLHLGSSRAYGMLSDDSWSAMLLLEELTLRTNLIGGTISKSIGKLKYLRELEISGLPELAGTLPESIGDCPIEELHLEFTSINHPLPQITEGVMLSTLRKVHINHLQSSGSIPDWMWQLPNLQTLDLSSSGLSGFLPETSGNLTNLKTLRLGINGLFGQLPDFPSLEVLDIHNNYISGTIPPGIIASANSLMLSHNHFGDTGVPISFLQSPNLKKLDLSYNRFTGSLPLFQAAIYVLDLSYNKFNGSIPDSYCHVGQYGLRLSNNLLSGSLEPLFGPLCTHSEINLSGNRFNGSWSWNISNAPLNSLDISDNFFSDSLPVLPPTLALFNAANNRFTRSRFEEFAASARQGDLQRLDLSGNHISFESETLVSPWDVIGPKLQFLSLAQNQFSSNRLSADTHVYGLIYLDLTANGMSGAFPSFKFHQVSVLLIANNSFSNDPSFFQLPSIAQLDISYNRFQFDVADLGRLPILTTVYASGNSLYGAVSLADLPNIQFVDLSWNDLDHTLDLVSISQKFTTGRLQVLRVDHNSIPTMRLDSKVTGLRRTKTSAKSRNYAYLVCYDLAFHNKSGIFTFQENLFQRAQCDCDQQHFGSASPAVMCYQCPPPGVSSCGAGEVHVPSNTFAILIPHQYGGGLMLTDNCLVTALQTVSGQSNCKGVSLNASSDFSLKGIQRELVQQCEVGSEGRLCSKCSCNITAGGGDCYFERGPKCAKCRHVLATSTSLPVTLAALIVIIILLSAAMAIVLRRKRVQSLESWEKMPIIKRIFYRLIYLTSLGNVSILVSFLQILLSFTQWDAYAETGVLSFLYNSGQGLGLGCIFPFLNEPLWALIAKLSIPYIAVGIVATSIGIGSLISNMLAARDKKMTHSLNHPSEASFDDAHASLLSSLTREVPVEYPSLALLTSLSITLVKFFYFGTALAAHQYLFSVKSRDEFFSQQSPWMKYSQAWPLIQWSIPSVIIFDLVLPLAFAALCWSVRKTFQLPSVQIYFGTLFETYNPNCYWWEMINILKKLSIAMALKSIPDSDATQTALVSSILLGILALQVTVNPWRRKTENFSDCISTLILCGALLSTRPGQLVHASSTIWYVFVLSVIFTTGSVVLIVWQTVTGKTDYQKRLEAIWTNKEQYGAIQERLVDEMAQEWQLESDLDPSSSINSEMDS